MNKTNYSEVLKRVWEIRRKRGDTEPWNKKPAPPKELLERLYHTEKKSTHEIGLMLGCKTNMSVRRWMREYNIPLRTLRENYYLKDINGFKRDKNHPNWKGKKVGYGALHAWVKLRLGKPNICEHCGRTDQKKYEWANKSHKYLRDVSDWLRLCTGCHRKYDAKHRKEQLK